MSHRIAAFAAASGLVLTSMAAPAGAHVGTTGTYNCRLSATKLGARIEVTLRLRSSDADREWRVRMWDGGVKFADRTRITNDLGRLRVVGVTKNRPGVDEIVGSARDQVTGGRCEVALSI
ncbi:MAG: hypothetical protein ACXWZU_03320 [Actinomycetota bacterium]